MTCHFYIRSAGYGRKQYVSIINIIRYEIVRQRKMLVHRPDDGGQSIRCPGAMRPFARTVRFGNSNNYHQYLTLFCILILFLMISFYQNGCMSNFWLLI